MNLKDCVAAAHVGSFDGGFLNASSRDA